MSLCAVLRLRYGAVEADLKRFYQVDLRDLWREGGGESGLTLSLLWSYLEHLPATSALAISENGGTQPWTMADHLAADTWLAIVQSNSKKGKAPKDHPRRESAQAKLRDGKAARRRASHEQAKARNAERLRLAGR